MASSKLVTENEKESLIASQGILATKGNMNFDTIKDSLKKISETPTPKEYVKSLPSGFEGGGYDYIEEAYMRHLLNKHFPIWSWIDGRFEVLGGEWILVSGTLVVQIEYATKRFWSTGAARIQFKRDKDHVAANVINIDHNIASANSNAFKRAINRLCNIGDDVYQKQILEPLSDKEIDKIKGLAKEVGKLERIEYLLQTGEISRANYEKRLKQLMNLKKK